MLSICNIRRRSLGRYVFSRTIPWNKKDRIHQRFKSVLSDLLNPSRVIKPRIKKLPNFEKQTVWELLNYEKGNWGKEIAYECAATGFKLMFDDVFQIAENFGASLLKCGLHRGDVVAIVLPNCPQYAPIVLAMLATGIVASPMDPTVPVERLQTMVNIISPKAIVTFPENLDNMIKLKELTTIQVIILVGRAKTGYLNFIEMIGTVPLGLEFINGQQVRTSEEVAILTWSTGLTSNGRPRAISLTHYGLVAQILQLAHKKASLCKRGVETFLGVTPFSYSNSTVLYLILSMLIGAKVITLPSFNPRLLVRAIRDHKPTCLHLFPPQFKFLEQHPAIKREHFVDTHTIMCNGSVMPSKPTVEALLHKAGKDIFFQGSYGIPEVPYCFMMEPGSKNNHLLTSVGRPLANTVAKVFDLSTGSGLGAYEEGEIGIKGPQTMKGYWLHANAKGWGHEVLPGNWFHTGDIGYYDEDKCFHITEHKYDLIVARSAVVWPNRFEMQVREMDGVQDVSVIGVASITNGRMARVHIVKRNPFLTSEDVIRHLKMNQESEYHKLESEIVFIPYIPRSYTGANWKMTIKENVRIFLPSAARHAFDDLTPVSCPRPSEG